MKNVTSVVSLAGATVFCACSLALAQTSAVDHNDAFDTNADTQANAITIVQADEISVTATRIPTRSSALVSDVQIFEKEEIERAVGKSLPEFLQQASNIQIASNGGPGQLSSVFTRGTESNHTLVLIDGVRYGAISDGAPRWAALPLANIDRIEVLKGPASTLYGSDAVGGVVQIFTKRELDGFHPTIRLSAGSRKMTEVNASFSGGSNGVHYSLGVSDLYDRSFSASNVNAGVFEPDRDSFSQRTYNAALSWKVAKDWRVGAALFQNQGQNNFDSGRAGGGTKGEIGSELRKVFVQGKVSSKWNTELSYGQTQDQSETLVSRFGSNFFNSTQNLLSWQNDVQVPYAGTLLLGTEHLQQKLESSSAFTVNARTVKSVFAGVTGSHAAHDWQLNWRRDDNSQYGLVNTGFVGYGIQALPSLRLRTSYGTSFSAPTFNDLYLPPFDTQFYRYRSNPNLRPEKGQSIEIGAEWNLGLHTFTLTRFENRIRDLIITSAYSPPIPATTNNIDKARIRGWNIGYSGQIGLMELKASYEHLDPRDAVTGVQLTRRARQQFTVGAEYALNAWRLGAAVVHTGKRPDIGFTTTNILPAYTLLNLNASYALHKDWSLQARVDNVANKTYETVFGFNQPGRSFYVTLQYAF